MQERKLLNNTNSGKNFRSNKRQSLVNIFILFGD